MNRNSYNVKAVEGNIVGYSGKFVTNNTGAPDGLSATLSSVTRTAAGKFTVLFKDKFPQCYFPDVRLVGAAGYNAQITAITEASSAVVGCTVEVHGDGTETSAVAAASVIQCDEKADTTDDDFFILNDGSQTYAIILSTTDGATGLANGTDYVADQTVIVDISTSTSTVDAGIEVAALVAAAVDGSDIQATIVDVLDGTITVTQDNAGPAGNVQQSGYGTLHGTWAVTDATGGIDGTQAAGLAADTTDYDVYLFFWMRNSKLTHR